MAQLQASTVAGTLTTTGNVGVGTVASPFKQTIYDSTAAATVYQTSGTGAGNSNGFYVGHTGNISYVWNYNNFPLVLATNNTERIRVTSGGDVGIGTDVPYGGTNVRSLTVNATQFPVLALQAGGVRKGELFGFSDHVSFFTPGYLTLDPGDTEAVRITTGGNVGIGTTNPSRRLHVTSTTDTRGIMVQQNLASSYAEVHFSASREYRIGTGGSTSATEAANNWYVYDATAAAQRLAINSIGYVGIGTDNPADKLDVNGGIVVRGANYIWSGVTTTIGSWTTRQYANGAVYTFNVNGFEINNVGYGSSTWFKILSDGNVGIGTVSPEQKLDVRGTIYSVNSGTDGGQIRVQNSGGGNAWYWAARTTGLNLGQLGVADARIFVTNGGSVGIGTDNPFNGSKLEVRGSGVWDGGVITLNNTGAGGGIWSIFSTNNLFSQGGGKLLIYNATADTNAMVINSSNNVGIGTNNPSTPLHIARTAAVSPSIRLQTIDSTTNGAIIWANSTNSVLAFIGSNSNISDGSGNLEFATGGTSTKMVLNSAGNLGIGTATPGAKLVVNGFTKILGSSFPSAGSAGGLEFNYIEPTSYIGSYDRNVGSYKNLFLYASDITFETSAVIRMFIASGGNVGIGNTNPKATFVIGTESSATNGSGLANDNSILSRVGASDAGRRVVGFTVANTASPTVGSDSSLSFIVAGNYSATGIISTILQNTGNAISDMTFTLWNGSAIQERMRIAGGGNVGIGTDNPSSTLHVDSGATGATAYALRTDAASLDYALYVSSSGNVAVGGLVPASQLNHKFVVFSGSIALRGPNDPSFSYRLNDTGGTNRNALYVSSSNYLNVGNAAFAGIELFHTGSAPDRKDGDPGGINGYYGSDGATYLAEPNKWLAVRVAGTNYVIPMYE